MMMSGSAWITWLGQIPREIVNASPELLLTEVSIGSVSYRDVEIQSLLTLADQLIDGMPATPEREALQGEAAGFRTQIYFGLSDTRSCIAAAETGLRLAPRNCWTSRVYAWLMGCVAQAIEGNRAKAYEQIYSSFVNGTRPG